MEARRDVPLERTADGYRRKARNRAKRLRGANDALTSAAAGFAADGFALPLAGLFSGTSVLL